MRITRWFLSLGFFLFLITNSAYTQSCGNPLTTFYNTNNGQDGIMFSISAKRNLVIDSFANNYANGTISQILIYYKWGLATGYLTTPGAWTLIGTVNGVTSSGTNNPTLIPINVNLAVPKYQTVSFYITTNGGSNPICRYTNGQGVCDSLDGNADLNIYEGYGKDYPFATSFSPRQFNGTVYYHCTTNPSYSIVGPTSLCNVYVGQTAQYYINPPLTGSGIYWSVPSGMSNQTGNGNDSITVQFTSTNPQGNICAALVGCDTFAQICSPVVANPGVADAGNDTSICFTSYQLDANQGFGYWRVLSGGGYFVDSTDNNTVVNGLSLGLNVLEWNIGGYGCDTISDTVEILVYPSITANFIPDDVCDGQLITLLDSSFIIGGGYVASRTWDVDGDGTFDYTSTNASTTYSSYGEYDAKLIVTSNAGCIDSVVKTIVIHPNPVAIFGYVSECEGESLQITDLSTIAYTSITNWTWHFGDSTSVSDVQNPSHIFSNDGTYSVYLLAVSEFGCFDDTIMPVLVYRLPEPDFLIPPDCQQNIFSCTDSSKAFNGDFLVDWSWEFGDGTPTDANQSTIHIFPTPGLYHVTLTVVTDKACTNSVSLPVEVYPTPVSYFGFEGICENEVIYFYDSSTVEDVFNDQMVEWNWDLGNGKQIDKQNTLASYEKAGPYTISLEVVTNYGCHDYYEREITVRPSPEAHFLILDDEVCAGNRVHFSDETFLDHKYDAVGVNEWSWSFGDGKTSNINRPSNRYDSGGVYKVVLIASTGYGCKDTTFDYANIYHNPIAEYSLQNSQGCSPLCVDFVDESRVPGSSDMLSRIWHFGDGDSLTGIHMSHCYVADQGGNDSIYKPWLKVITIRGCVDEFHSGEVVKVHPAPLSQFSVQKEMISVLDSVMYFYDESEGAIQWLWDFGDSTYSALANPETHTYSESGDYAIKLFVWSDDGCVDSSELSIYVKAHQTLYIPNSFTPNGDEKNPVFQIYGEGLEFVHLLIYDRWGNLMFDGTNDDAAWDGTSGGQICPVGVYAYLLTYRHSGQSNKKKSGQFVISKNNTGLDLK